MKNQPSPGSHDYPFLSLDNDHGSVKYVHTFGDIASGNAVIPKGRFLQYIAMYNMTSNDKIPLIPIFDNG